MQALKGPVILLVAAAILWAQAFVRRVHGKVTGSDGKPIHGAIVQIEDLKTLQIRTFITKKDGRYYFNDLSTRESYELKAKHRGRTSSTETLTKFNSDDPAVVNLEIE
jgi:hypothetical protein